MGRRLSWLLTVLTILIRYKSCSADFMEAPTTLEVTAGTEAVFRCQHSGADSLGWRVNYTSVERYPLPDISEGLGILTILALPEYNGTVVECVALYFDGSFPDLSPPAYLIVQVVQCPDLSDSIENGEVVITPIAAEYSCNDGYRLDNGDAERTCQAEGTWSGEAPQCFVQCPDLSDSIENGEVVITPTARTVNSTAEYSCNDGYRLDNGDAERTCQTEGTWSGEAPQCFIQCPDLGDSIENGEVFITPTARTVNSTAEYSCTDGGYKLDKGDAKRTCLAGGTWSGEAPQCIPLDKRSNIPAIVGGVVGGLVVLGIILSLIVGIEVAIKLKKKDDVEQYKSKKDDHEDVPLEENPAYTENDADVLY